MAYDERLVARVRDLLSRPRDAAEKKMFGGVGFLIRGNMAVGVQDRDLVVRVGPQEYDAALTRAHVREFDFTGQPMTGWIVVGPKGTASRRQLESWVKRGVQFADSLPEKRAQPAAATKPRLLPRLERKGVDRQRLALEVMRDPTLIPEAMAGLRADRPAHKYGCAKILRVVAERQPDLLYPHFATFRAMLDDDNRILQWEAIHVLGHLAAVDDKGRITRLLDRYLEPVRGPVLITAANTIAGAGRIGAAKPRLADRIARALLGVERGRYQTPECRHVALGGVVDAMEQIFPHLKDTAPTLAMMRRLAKNPRPATRKKAERFLARRAKDADAKLRRRTGTRR